MLCKINPKNLKVVVNYELRSASSYLKRAQIARYSSPNKKIHIISLIDEGQTRTYEEVEENCKVQLEELPSQVPKVLVDDIHSQNGDNNFNTNDDQ